MTARCAIYVRYSSDLQSESSIEDQIVRCTQHVERLGGTVIEIYQDRAQSASSLDRPGMNRLRNDVRAKGREFDTLVTEDMSRVSRDVADSATILKELDFYQVRLESVADGLRSTDKSSATNFFFKSLMDQRYIADLSDKTLRGLRGKARAGLATGAVPFGFRTVADEVAKGRRIEIEPEQAELVRRMFRLFAEGHSLLQIAATLNGDSPTPPRGGVRGWVDTTIRQILRNETYIGRRTYNRKTWKKRPGTNKRVPFAADPRDVIVNECPHLRIVDQELWELAQERIKKKPRVVDGTPKRGVQPARSNYVLSGLLRCAACGELMVIGGGSGGTRYYQCVSNKKRGTCSNKLLVRENIARERILGEIAHQIRTKEAIAYVRKQLAKRVGQQGQEAKRDLAARQDRLFRVETQIKNTTQAIANGAYSDALMKCLADLEANQKDLVRSIEQLKRATSDVVRLPNADDIVNRVFDLTNLLPTDPLRGRRALEYLLADGRILLTPGKGSYLATAEVLPLNVLLPAVQNMKDSQRTEGPLFGDPLNGSHCGGRI